MSGGINEGQYPFEKVAFKKHNQAMTQGIFTMYTAISQFMFYIYM